jgi:hypothetical protein
MERDRLGNSPLAEQSFREVLAPWVRRFVNRPANEEGQSMIRAVRMALKT